MGPEKGIFNPNAAARSQQCCTSTTTIELRALPQELKENKWLQPIETPFDD
jgi:hypothetical protein